MEIENSSREEIAKFIGENLRSVRLEKGLSQKDIAVKLGHKKTWISEIERGEALASILTIRQICKAMEIDPLVFMLKCLSEIDWKEVQKAQIREMFSSN